MGLLQFLAQFHFLLLGLATGIGSLSQRSGLVTACDLDPLAIVEWVLLDSNLGNHILSPRNLELEFRDLCRV